MEDIDINIKWHCPHCLFTVDDISEEVAEQAAQHLDVAHEVDVSAMDDDAILALDAKLVHEIADMYADSLGGVPVDELHREFALDVLKKVDEVRGER